MSANNEHPIDRYVGDRYPEVLRTMAVELYVQLTSTPALAAVLPANDAALMAFRVTEAVRQTHSGMSFYIGKGVQYECSARDREIYSRFNGMNYVELARQYDLTEMRVRQIINACREEDRRRRQGDLFGN